MKAKTFSIKILFFLKKEKLFYNLPYNRTNEQMTNKNNKGMIKNLAASQQLPNSSTTSHKKNSGEIAKNDLENKPNILSSSLNFVNSGKKSNPAIEIKPKSAYPSELKPLDLLISKTNIKFTNSQLKKYCLFREVGFNIYEALSFAYVEEIFKRNSMTYITNFIELMKNPEYHILTNPEHENKNKKISKELKQKYLFAQNDLIALFESYLDILLNDQDKRYDVIYDFYCKCSKNEDIKLACNALIRGMVAGFYSQSKKNLSEYKIFNLEENIATFSEFDLITNAIDVIIDIYEGEKNLEVKSRRYKYGVQEEPNAYLKILSYGYSYYILYENDQKHLLEKEVIKNNLKSKEFDKPGPKIEGKKNCDSPIIKGDDNKLIDEEKKKNSLRDIPSKEIIQTCGICNKKNHKKQLFVVKKCKHTICFDCMLQKYYNRYSHTDINKCPDFKCSSSFYDEDVQEYFNEIQISESITMTPYIPQSESGEIQNKLTELNSESSVINLEPKVKCVYCRKNTPQSENFINPNCYHCFCYDCVSKKMTSNCKLYNFCPEKSCTKHLMQKSVDKFLHDFLSRDAKKNLIEISQECYYCKKKFKLTMAIGADFFFFECKSCKISSCLIHCAPLSNCFCFCTSCNIKTEADWMRPSCLFCPDCKRKFCLLCKNSISKCNCYCDVCGSILLQEKDSVFCKNCEENCKVCGIKTNDRNKLIGAKCGHVYCRSCAFEKLTQFSKESCLKKTYY